MATAKEKSSSNSSALIPTQHQDHPYSSSLTVLDARGAYDPDVVAIQMALEWSGKHLSKPNMLDRRFISVPISRYVVPIPVASITS